LFVVVMHTVAVGAQNNTLLYFFPRSSVPPVSYKYMHTGGLGGGVYVMEVNYRWVAHPTDSARQRGLILLPLGFFSLMLHRSARYRKLFVVGVVPGRVLALFSPALV
jgi:hypothetical protein